MKESLFQQGLFSILVYFLSFNFIFLVVADTVCNEQDRDSLLLFSGNISSSPATSLNWTSSTDCCFWEGISCDPLTGSVTGISLPFRNLAGKISPSLLNLSRLSFLDLSHNHLTGTLPPGFFSSLDQIQILDLSDNNLNGQLSLESNSVNISLRIFPVREIDLSSNQFTGEILQESSFFLQGALNLASFNVSNNMFKGPIPSFICSNSPDITLLDFSFNDFGGEIPLGLGKCSKLKTLRAGFNHLNGTIPDEVFNLLELQELFLPVNKLSGGISHGVTSLTRLTILELYSNQFTGFIATDIGKLSNLQSLQLHVNKLTGPLPRSLSNCTKLVILNLRVNSLYGELSSFDFSQFQNLSILDLGNNNFTGELPRTMYLCKSLTAVRLASNGLIGQISPEILELRSLSFISVSTNNLTNFTGALSILQASKSLSTLLIAKNFYDETVSSDENLIAPNGFQRLQIFGIGGSRMKGEIPVWISKIKSLEVMDLSQNRFTGLIPKWLGTLPNLLYLDLSDNLLTGELPKELCQLRALSSKKAYDELNWSYLELPVFVNPNNITTNQQYNQLSSLPPAIYIRNNSLTGTIPAEIGLLQILHVLELSHNSLSGSIPDSLSNLTNLERLDLSYNNLSGEIPSSLMDLNFLSYLDVAHNNLEGRVPSGGQFDTFPAKNFEGNMLLCGSIMQRSCPDSAGSSPTSGSIRKTNTGLVLGLVLGSFLGMSMILVLLAFCVLTKRKVIPGSDSEKLEMDAMSSDGYSVVAPESDNDMSLVLLFGSNNGDRKDLTILDLLKATNNFNQENIIGCGGFGMVYKATMDNGTKLAVKKLTGDFGLMEKEFKAEVEVLSRAKHENLVSLQGYCIHEGCRILIYNYMENGSLDYWLHENPDGRSQLDWKTRLNIARGASYGLAYMHQKCEPHIVHRDIKSSNILLDVNFKAYVADFGLSRLIDPYRTHVTTELVGTLGYIPPEYGQAWVATLRGDVYSLGIVMLELLTGKRPMEMFKPKMMREIVSWVHQMRSEGKHTEIFDPQLRNKRCEAEMLQVLNVACLCVNENPVKRPNIQEVVDWLDNVGGENVNQINREEQERV